MRLLPQGFECPLNKCKHHDAIGSEHSCNGGSIYTCPIVQGFMTDYNKECLDVGEIALQDDKQLSATHAYFQGKRAATKEEDA